jgi:hypothetical protein
MGRKGGMRMERLTYKNQDVSLVEGFLNRHSNFDGTKIADGLKKLAEYEDMEERLQKEYGANISISDVIDLLFITIEEQDGEPLKGFRILTNEDAKLYDDWKSSNNFWEFEAKKWCDQVFEYRLQLEGGK